MVSDLEVSKLQAMSRADHDRAIFLLDLPLSDQLFENRQRDCRMRACEHAGQIGLSRRFSQFLLTCLLDHSTRFLDGRHCFGIADRIADANRVGQGVLSFDRDFLFELILKRFVKWVGCFSLSRHEARHFVDHSQIHHQLKPFVQRTDVAKVADGDNDPVRNFPIELAANFHANGFLALDAKAVHAVGQVDRLVRGDLLDNLHAAVEVRVQRQHMGSIGDRLNQLSRTDLARR